MRSEECKTRYNVLHLNNSTWHKMDLYGFTIIVTSLVLYTTQM
jgi:hypothetical protein